MGRAHAPPHVLGPPRPPVRGAHAHCMRIGIYRCIFFMFSSLHTVTVPSLGDERSDSLDKIMALLLNELATLNHP